MFSRRSDRPKEEPRLAPASRPSALVPVAPSDHPPGGWTSAPYQPGPTEGGPSVMAAEATVIAERDQVEGALRSGRGVLVLGSFSGSIESETWVRTGEGSRVQADITADEVVVAGRYEGRLIARSRLEITPTGHILGDIEAPRLQLHEGGVIDGALFMTTHAADRRAAQGGAGGAAPSAAATSEATRRESVRGGGQGVSPRSGGRAAVPVGDPPTPAAPRPEPAEPPTPEPQVTSTPRS